MAGVVGFLENPLVTWVKTFSSSEDNVSFQDLSDAVYYLDVISSIDDRDVDETIQKVHRKPKDSNAKLHNWGLLMHTISSYYLEVLQQVIVMKTPDIFTIVEDPTKDCSLQELEKLLLLLLGCAVQCERKEHHINTIKSLDISAQKALVDCIKQVTDCADNVVAVDTYGDSDDAKQLYSVIKKVVIERDSFFQQIVQLKQEHDFYKNEVNKKQGGLTAPPSLESYQLQRDLQEYKSRAFKANEEIEEKGKNICELKEELEQTSHELNQLKSERLRLDRDAKLARTYRDELDNLKEQALKAEKYEKELTKYKEKVHELEYYKTRVEELREDNSLLCECKEKLEEQTTTTQEQLTEALKDVKRLQNNLDQTKQEKNELESKLSAAMEENAVLDFEKTRMKEGYTGPLRRMISYTSSEFLHGGSQLQLAGHPISDELNDSMTSHVTRLEVENDELKHELEQIKAKLYSTQQEVEALLNQSEYDYKKRLKSSDKAGPLSPAAKKLVEENNKQYESKLAELHTVLTKQSDQLHEHQGKQHSLERAKQSLERQVLNVENQWRASQKKCEDLSTEIRQVHRDVQLYQGKLTIAQEDLTKSQRENEDLMEQLSCIKAQVAKSQELQEYMKKENESLIQQLHSQENRWATDRDKCMSLQTELKHIEAERNDLKYDLQSLRECSDKHIKELEEQVVSLQNKSVAIENLNDYLCNLSVADNASVPEIIDTDLDAHLSLNSTKDDNHNDTLSHPKGHSQRSQTLPREYCPDVSDSGFKQPPPACSTPQMRRHRSQHRNSISSDADAYVIDSSQLYEKEQPARISYVRNGEPVTPSSSSQSNSNSLINKLKSYVKQPKGDGDRSGPRTPSHEVQMRDKGAFVRNSKQRSTIHGLPMAKSSPIIAKREKLHAPLPEANIHSDRGSFSRSNPMRQTMPERKSAAVYGKNRPSTQYGGYQSQISLDLEGTHQSHKSRPSSRHKNPPVSTSYDRSRQYSSDLDSGLGVSTDTSPIANNPGGETNLDDHMDNGHMMTDIHIMSTETVESHWKRVSLKVPEQWRALAEKVQYLHERNQGLIADNRDLRKALDGPSGAAVVNRLHKQLQQLQAENKKLRIIVETLQNTVSGRNPYDDKEYHYFTNV